MIVGATRLAKLLAERGETDRTLKIQSIDGSEESFKRAILAQVTPHEVNMINEHDIAYLS